MKNSCKKILALLLNPHGNSKIHISIQYYYYTLLRQVGVPSKKKLALVWHIKPANFCAVIAIAKLSSCHSFYIVVVCKKRARGLPCLVSSLWLHKKPLRKLIRAASQQRCVGSAKWLHEMVFCTRKIKGGVEHRDNTGLISSILSIF